MDQLYWCLISDLSSAVYDRSMLGQSTLQQSHSYWEYTFFTWIHKSRELWIRIWCTVGVNIYSRCCMQCCCTAGVGLIGRCFKSKIFSHWSIIISYNTPACLQCFLRSNVVIHRLKWARLADNASKKASASTSRLMWNLNCNDRFPQNVLFDRFSICVKLNVYRTSSFVWMRITSLTCRRGFESRSRQPNPRPVRPELGLTHSATSGHGMWLEAVERN